MTDFIKASSPVSSKNDSNVVAPSQARKIPSATFYTEEEYRTRISPPIDQIYLPSYYDLDTKWRSVAVAHQGTTPFMTTMSRVTAEKAAAPKGAANSFHAYVPGSVPSSSGHKHSEELLTAASAASSTRTDTSSESLTAPEQPLLLMPTHFETCVPIRCLVSNIERALLFIPELSYEMVPHDCMVRFFARPRDDVGSVLFLLPNGRMCAPPSGTPSTCVGRRIASCRSMCTRITTRSSSRQIV